MNELRVDNNNFAYPKNIPRETSVVRVLICLGTLDYSKLDRWAELKMVP